MMLHITLSFFTSLYLFNCLIVILLLFHEAQMFGVHLGTIVVCSLSVFFPFWRCDVVLKMSIKC